MKTMISQEEYDKVVNAFVDIVDGHDEHDIQCNTGLSLERCKEIHQLFCELVSKTNNGTNGTNIKKVISGRNFK